MTSAMPEISNLQPLPYHTALADYLKLHEPEVWRWESGRDMQQEQREALRLELLRDSYRIAAEAHPDVHACLQKAMEALDIHASVTLYQSSAVESNASLVFVPGEIHIILHGRLLEHMSSAEMTAIFGHELAHYVLWTRDKGEFHTVERVLRNAIETDYEQHSLRESYRRYLLHTELFADRGSALAVGAVEPAIAALIKTHTGISNVDAKAYLQQAQEIEAAEKNKSTGYSHPDAYLRARALVQWWNGEPTVDQWIAQQLNGGFELEALDLLQQKQMSSMIRGFLTGFLRDTEFLNDAVTAQMRYLFPDWNPAEAVTSIEELMQIKFDRGLKRVFNALMLDLCLIDPDQQDAMLQHAVKYSCELDCIEDMAINLRRDAGLTKREIDRMVSRIKEKASGLAQKAGAA